MGRVLIEKMLPTLRKMKWPETPEATELGRQAYLVGLERVDDFKTDPKALAAALRIFQTGDSLPFAYAGAAYTLVGASREKDDTYSQMGLDAALEWLEKAQDLAPDVLEINMVEAFIYVYSGRYDDTRLVLDYLEAIDPQEYYVLTAEVAYWQEQGNLEEAVRWYEEATLAADTTPRKLRLRGNLGDCYLRFGRYDEALEIYKEAVHFSKENPWLWHNMSVAYWNKNEYEESGRCNQHALNLRDFPEARQMEDKLRQKLGTGRLVGRLLGR